MTDSFKPIGEIASEVVGRLQAQRAEDRMVPGPGLYHMPAAAYHADPCPEPSLSCSIAKIMLGQSPHHARHAHPRLNPEFAETAERHERKIEIANVAHTLLLGDGRQFHIVHEDDWRTKDAKAAREQAHVTGKLPILKPDLDIACQMIEVARTEFSTYPEIAPLLADGAGMSELVVVWRDVGGIWCRAMLDRVDPRLRVVLDFKTTANAHPDACVRRIFDNDFQMQHPFYLRGLDALDPAGRGRRKFYFLYQETEPPHACSVVELDGHATAIGERQVEAAVQLWARCTAENAWPCWPRIIHRAGMPTWKETEWLAREEIDPSIAPAGGEPVNVMMGG